MGSFVIYNNSGEILRVGEAPDAAIYLQAQDNESVMKVDTTPEQKKYYVDLLSSPPTLKVKPEMGLTVSGVIVSGIISGTLVEVRDPDFNHTEYVITDGEVDMGDSSVGEYQLHFSKFPYSEEILEVTV